VHPIARHRRIGSALPSSSFCEHRASDARAGQEAHILAGVPDFCTNGCGSVKLLCARATMARSTGHRQMGRGIAPDDLATILRRGATRTWRRLPSAISAAPPPTHADDHAIKFVALRLLKRARLRPFGAWRRSPREQGGVKFSAGRSFICDGGRAENYGDGRASSFVSPAAAVPPPRTHWTMRP
jgi:hypothetical protein